MDLSPRLSQHLSPHLLLQILDHLIKQKTYPNEEIKKAYLATLRRTKLFSRTRELAAELSEPFDQSLADLFLADLDRRTADLAKTLEALRTHRKTLSDSNSAALLDVKTEEKQSLLKLSKLTFDCGKYEESLELVQLLLSCCQLETAEKLQLLWGRVTAQLLTKSFSAAFDSVVSIAGIIDSSTTGLAFTPVQIAHERVWLFTHSLFLLFTDSQTGQFEKLLELFFNQSYLSCIQSSSSFNLRYVAAAVILSKKRASYIRELSQIVRSESYQYEDGLCRLISSLTHSVNFHSAKDALQDCDKIGEVDYFLYHVRDAISKSCRSLVIETYVRIHSKFSLAALADILGSDLHTCSELLSTVTPAVTISEGMVIRKDDSSSIESTLMQKIAELQRRSAQLVNKVV